MPALQTALTYMNHLSHRDNIDSINSELFGPGANLADAISLLGDDAPAELAEYLQALPVGIAEACRAVIFSALNRSPRQPITFAWAPAYDYELQVWDISDTSKTRGGITLLLKSRYPDDPHPLA